MTPSTYVKIIKLLGLLFWLFVSLLAGGIGSVAIENNPNFFDALNKPDGTPSPHTITIIWLVLYILMGVSAWLAWCQKPSPNRYYGLCLFLVQLVLNALWCWLFFYWQNGSLSFIDTLCMLLMVFAIIILFWRVDKWASILLVPYLLWLIYAAVLNFELWQMNPEMLGDQKTELQRPSSSS